jgi:RimJ/RimL family protein N-acetyltransferase
MQLPPRTPTLTDGVVTLRPHRPDDVEAVLAQCQDPQMQRWTTVPVPYERRHAVEWLGTREQEWAQGRTLAFAIEAGGRFCGTVDLRLDGQGAAAVGFGLGPWARGQGLTARALRLALPWAFQQGLEVVHWSAMAGNWASRRVAWSVGFRVEGTVRGLLAARGTRADGWIGSLDRGDRLEPAHPWLDTPVLVDERVRLRPHGRADTDRIAQACSDPVTQRWLPQLPQPYTLADARAHLEQIAEDGAAGRALYWAVADPADDRLLGEIGLFGLGRIRPRSVEIGYWTHPAARGRGAMTAAVRLVSRHALLPEDVGGLGADRVLLRAADGNTASCRVAERAGFRRSGTDRRAELLRDGTVADLLRFDLVPDDLAPATRTPADPDAVPVPPRSADPGGSEP